MEQFRIIFPLRHKKKYEIPPSYVCYKWTFYLELNFGKQILLNNCQKRAWQTYVRSAPAVSAIHCFLPPILEPEYS